jgi:FimV-like protein
MNTTTNTTTPQKGSSIDEALGQTEFGGWISQNKMPVISAVVVLIVGIFAYGIFDHFKTERENKYSSALHQVVKDKLTPFREGKIEASELVKSFNDQWLEMGSFVGAGTFVVQVVDALMAKNKYAEAYALVADADQRISNPQLSYFFNIRAAALAEDLGKKKEAITHLKKIAGSGIKYFESKVYLDLGRLYLETGDKEKARSSFQFVIDEGKEVEFKKVARLYLEELEG